MGGSTGKHDDVGAPVQVGAPVGPAVGLVGLVGLLALLDPSFGLGKAGWSAGLACALAVIVPLTRGLARRRDGAGAALSTADRVTLVRAMLTSAVAALVVADLAGAAVRPTAPAVVALAGVALVLDLVDGRLARGTGTVSGLGARFDLEVDALLLLVLSAYVVPSLGLWVLAIGLARYAFWAAGLLWPWLRGTAPARPWCKVVAAFQGIALVIVATGWLPPVAATILLVVALGLLTESFAHEAWDLRRLRDPLTSRRHSPAVAMLAPVVLWLVLVAPADASTLTATAFLRIPVEGILLLALLLALPDGGVRRVALAAGGVLALLTVLKLLDLVTSLAFDRPFDPLGDPVHVGDGLGFLRDALGTANAATVAVVLAVVLLGVLVTIPLALDGTARAARSHRRIAGTVLLALGVGWVAGAATGARVSSDLPLAAATEVDLASGHVAAARTQLRERAALTAAIADDPYRDIPASRLLTGLRGKDVLLVFVESYGRVALEGLPTSGDLVASVDADTARLQEAGFRARSGWLTSPTFGAMSWLAHSTLQSGLWIDHQGGYDQLMRAERLTLSSAFRAAGWRSVGVVPANTEDWPAGPAFYGWDALYDARNLGYEGPRFGYGRMPDQFALEAFRRLELAPPGRGPVMAEIDLQSSHNPWVPLPRLVDPATLGDGSVFDPMPAQGEQRAEVWRDPERVKAAYVRSLQYSLDSLVGFVETAADDDLVLVVVGDHQPVTTVSGTTSGRDVPISVVARDPAVLGRIAEWGWTAGLRPDPKAPVWPMDAFRDRFLTAYGPLRG